MGRHGIEMGFKAERMKEMPKGFSVVPWIQQPKFKSK